MESDTNDGLPALRILIADDSRDAADTLACLVRFWGHEVQVFYGGREALEAARTYLPEVVMLDIGMPVLDGYQVAERCVPMRGCAMSR